MIYGLLWIGNNGARKLCDVGNDGTQYALYTASAVLHRVTELNSTATEFKWESVYLPVPLPYAGPWQNIQAAP